MKPKTPKHISIIGISGTGKTTLARRMSRALGIPVIHYDTICWAEGWQEVDEAIVRKQILEKLHEDSWILDGYINPAALERLKTSDLVIYLDSSGSRALWGGIRRWWKYRGTHVPEMPVGCTQEFKWDRWSVMWTRDERKEIEREIQGFEKKVVRLKSPKEMEKYVKKIFGVMS